MTEPPRGQERQVLAKYFNGLRIGLAQLRFVIVASCRQMYQAKYDLSPMFVYLAVGYYLGVVNNRG